MPQKESAIEYKVKPLISQWSTLACLDYINDLSWSPNAYHLVSADAAGRVIARSVLTGYSFEDLTAHTLGALCVRFSPDGNFVASAGQDGKANIYDSNTYAKVATIDHGDSWVEQIAWHQSSRCILTASGKTLRLSATDGNLIRKFEDHKSTIYDLAWNPAAPDLFATSSYNGIRLWSKDQTNHKRFLAWKGSLLNIAYSPNAKVLAAGCQDGAAHIWLLPSADELFMNGYQTKVRELSWDSSSRYLATGGSDQITVWDFSGKGPSGSKPIVFAGHEGSASIHSYSC
jgi:WD40 repeat protein